MTIVESGCVDVAGINRCNKQWLDGAIAFGKRRVGVCRYCDLCLVVGGCVLIVVDGFIWCVAVFL